MEKFVKKIFEGYKEFWLKDGKGKLKTLVDLFIRYELFVLKWSILFPLMLVDWFFSSFAGFGVMTFLALGIYILPYPLSLIIFMFFSDMLSVMFACVILAQFDLSRKYLIMLIGEENYNQYIGANPGSNLGVRMVQVGGFIMAIGLGKIGLDVTQDYVNGNGASWYAEKCRKEGVVIDPERFHKHFDRRPGDFIKDIYKNVPKK